MIDETLREAQLTDELGFDVIWLAEHHFDGICAYVDPISFAAALATADAPREDRLRRGADGVAPPDPHGRADLADRQLSQGRLIVGLGRGTAYNIYDYQGFGIDHTEAQARFEEAEAIMFEAWKGAAFEHHGEFFNLKLPVLRPRPIHEAASLTSSAPPRPSTACWISPNAAALHDERAKQRVTQHRMELYRRTLRSIGQDEATRRRQRRCLLGLAQCLRRGDRCRSGTDRRPGFPCHARRTAPRCASASIEEQGVSIVPMPAPGTPPPRAWCWNIRWFAGRRRRSRRNWPPSAIGIGGLIMQFRLGPMCYDDTAQA